MILVDSRQPIEEKGTIYQFRQSQREIVPNLGSQLPQLWASCGARAQRAAERESKGTKTPSLIFYSCTLNKSR